MSESGADRQRRIVLTMRVAGVVLSSVALVLLVTGFIGFVGAMSSDTGSEDFPPTSFWVFAAGLPFLAAGVFCLQVGFFGAATRFLARESTPALRQVKDDLWPPPPPPTAPQGSGPFCGSCGARRGADDRFCPGCGTALGTA